VIVILENFAVTLEQVVARTPVKHIVVARLGDMLGFPKGHSRQLRRQVCQEDGSGVDPAARGQFPRGARQGCVGRAEVGPVSQEDLAFLQYTGGTTGLSKGAMLMHRNILANLAQAHAWIKPALGTSSTWWSRRCLSTTSLP
jgi:long-chain acyl-CoA synthetase